MGNSGAVDWYERLFGVQEGTYDEVKSHFKLDGARLICTCSGKSFGVGAFHHSTVEQLRQAEPSNSGAHSQANAATDSYGSDHGAELRGNSYEVVFGDVADLHSEKANRHATFQVRKLAEARYCIFVYDMELCCLPCISRYGAGPL